MPYSTIPDLPDFDIEFEDDYIADSLSDSPEDDAHLYPHDLDGYIDWID